MKTEDELICPSSSSNIAKDDSSSATIRGCAKKEDDEIGISNRHHRCNNNNNNNNRNGTTMNSDDDLNPVPVQAVVKKEEEEKVANDHHNENNETQISSKSIDDNYDDWGKGNWCWLLPATNNNNTNGNINDTTRRSKSSVTRSVKSENGDTNIDAASATTGITPAATSTSTSTSTTTCRNSRGIVRSRRSMYRDDNDDNDGNSDDATDDDEKKPPPKKKMRHYRPVNDNIKEEEEEEEAYNTTTNDIHDNDIGKSNKEGDDEEGYESWTEGNWCLILPFPPAVVDEIETAGPSATTRRRRVVRNRNSSHQQSYEEDGGKCNEDYNDDNDDDDDDDDDDDVSSANSKTRKGKIMRYTKLQNERWDESFQRLVVTYRKEHKYINVPQRYATDPTLGAWVSNQRHYYKNKELSIKRIRRLNSIGFAWKLKDIVPWEGMYQKLAAYKKQHKSANVPQRYAADPTLGSWVSNQRYYYKNKVLSVKRMRRLDSIGFAWKLKDIVPWEEMYQRLVAYKKQHKSTNVPRKHQLHLKLGEWVHNQRNCYTKKEISVERIKRLDSIGFVWKLKDIVSWDEMYLRLVAYKKKHKSTNIPFRYEADPRLGQWVSTQRKYHSNKTLSIERINRLDSI